MSVPPPGAKLLYEWQSFAIKTVLYNVNYTCLARYLAKLIFCNFRTWPFSYSVVGIPMPWRLQRAKGTFLDNTFENQDLIC